MDSIANAARITDSDDFQRAYELHGRFYEGQRVSDEDAAWFRVYWNRIADDLIALPVEERPLSLTIWLTYTQKYLR